MFSVLLIASYTVLELGSILGPEVSGEFLKWMDRNLPSMCAIPRRMIFCSSLMLLAPGIFPKFLSIPSLISPSAPTITSTVSVLIPHILMDSVSRSLYFESFSMTFVEVFWLDGTNTSVSLQHWLALSLITISGLLADSSLSVFFFFFFFLLLLLLLLLLLYH